MGTQNFLNFLCSQVFNNIFFQRYKAFTRTALQINRGRSLQVRTYTYPIKIILPYTEEVINIISNNIN